MNYLDKLARSMTTKTKSKSMDSNFSIYNITATLKLKFSILFFLYTVFGIFAYLINYKAGDMSTRAFDTSVWLKARSLMDFNVVSTSNLYYKSLFSNTTMDHQRRAKKSMNFYRILHQDVKKSFIIGFSTEPFIFENGTSAQELWDKKTTKAYFGHKCVDIVTCNAPAIGHSTLLWASRMLTTLQHQQWQLQLVQMQLEILQHSNHLNSQSIYAKAAQKTYRDQYSIINIICASLILLAIIILCLLFQLTKSTIHQLGRTHNRLKILQERCCPTDTTLLHSLDIINKSSSL